MSHPPLITLIGDGSGKPLGNAHQSGGRCQMNHIKEVETGHHPNWMRTLEPLRVRMSKHRS